MKRCKNTECDNEIKEKRTYCSLKCRNIYVNKNLRDYSKCATTISLRSVKKYYENPKKCINCEKIIPYEKRRNGNFCSHSCSAKVSNKKRGKIIYSKEGLERLKKSGLESAKKNFKFVEKFEDSKKEYYEKPNFCKNCDCLLEYEKRNKKFCNKLCYTNFARESKSKKMLYKIDCGFKFNLSDYENEFNFDLVKKHGWYSPSNSKKPNLNGVSRDHMFSIDEGFKNNVEPNIINHPANCSLILQKDNSSKYKKSSITLEELKERIKNWDLKYKF